MKYKLFKTTTSKLIPVFIQNTTSVTGAGLTGLTYASSGLSWYYLREGAAAPVAVTLANMTVGTWASGGFKEIDATNMPGFYQVGVPNAAIATGANSVSMVFRGAASMVPRPLEIELDAINYQDTVRAGLTALPNAADGAAGGLTTIITANATPAQVATALTNYDATIPADITSALATAAIPAGVWSVATRALTDKADFALTSAYDDAKTAAQAGDAMALTAGERTTLAASIWNALTSGMTTVGSIGKKFADWLVGDVSSFSVTLTVQQIIAAILGVTVLQTRVEQRLRRVADSTSTNFTAACILEALNDAYVRWFQATLDASRTCTISCTDDVDFYALPDDAYNILEVRYGTTLLTRTTQQEMVGYNPTWRDADASTPSYWMRNGNLGLQIYPPPAVTTAVNLSVLVNIVPTAPTSPVTTGAIALLDGVASPVTPTWTQQALVAGAVSYLAQHYLYDDPVAQQVGPLDEADFKRRVGDYNGTKVN